MEENFRKAALDIQDGNYASALDHLIGKYVTPHHDPVDPYSNFGDVTYSVRTVLDTMPWTPSKQYRTAHLCGLLADIYRQMGDTDQAFNYAVLYRNSLRGINDQDTKEYQLASILLAEQYVHRNRLDSAQAIRSAIYPLLARTNDSSGFVEYQHLLGLIALKQNQPGEAIRLYTRGLQSQPHNTLRTPGYYWTALDLGRLLIQTRDLTSADSLFRKISSRMLREHYNNTLLEQSLENYYETLLYEQKYDSCKKYLRAFMEVMFTKTNQNVKGLSEREMSFYISRLDRPFDLLYTLYFTFGGDFKSYHIDVFGYELEHKSLLYLNRRDMLRLRDGSLSQDDVPIPYGHFHRTLELLARQAALPAYSRTLSLDSLQQLADAYERKIGIRSNADLARNRVDATDFASTQTEGTQININYIRYLHLSIDTPEGTPSYAAMLFGNYNRNVTLVPLCRVSQVRALLEPTGHLHPDQAAVAEELYATGSKVASDLYHLIWLPMEHYLSTGEGIAYSPVDILHDIAFNSLYDGHNYLLDKYRMVRILSFEDNMLKFQDAQRNEPYVKPQSASIWGDIDYNTAIVDSSRIPYPRRSAWYDNELTRRAKEQNANWWEGEKPVWQQMPAETSRTIHSAVSYDDDTYPWVYIGTGDIQKLEALFKKNGIKTSLHTGNRATEEEFKDSSKNIAGLLHISTHGFYKSQDNTMANDSLPGKFIKALSIPQLRCGLVLSGANYYWRGGIPAANLDDGILTGYEIQQLDLHKVQLVTLSACETGLGQSTSYEGNLGLLRSFKIAGARYILASLWEVPAETTTQMMLLFYQNWFGGESLPDAFQHAQISIRKVDPNPVSWAGFFLIE